MHTAVLYYTKTGHSRRVSNAIGAELGVASQPIEADPKLSGVDLLFIVSGIYGGVSDPKMVDYAKKLHSSMVKRAALSTSCTGGIQRQHMVRQALTANGIQVLADEFACRGSFLIFGLGHPSKIDVDNAVRFTRSIN